jgi:hypothetical protein
MLKAFHADIEHFVTDHPWCIVSVASAKANRYLLALEQNNSYVHQFVSGTIPHYCGAFFALNHLFGLFLLLYLLNRILAHLDVHICSVLLY